VQGVSEVVNFTITKPPEPFPTAFVLTTSGASVAVVGVVLVVYFKKRNGGRNPRKENH